MPERGSLKLFQTGVVAQGSVPSCRAWFNIVSEVQVSEPS